VAELKPTNATGYEPRCRYKRDAPQESIEPVFPWGDYVEVLTNGQIFRNCLTAKEKQTTSTQQQ